VLGLLDWNNAVKIGVDLSGYALGAIFMQQDKLIAYFFWSSLEKRVT
jgi:hypothetical protein